MRIMIAHSQYRWQGGEETTIRNQKQALGERGHEVILHIVENPTGIVNSLGALSMAPFNPLEYRSARAAIRNVGPDVVHVHNTWFQLSPAIFRAANDEDVPIVATIQNYRLACPQGQFFRDGGPCTDCLGRFPWPGVRHACYRGSRPLTLWNGLTTSVSQKMGWLNSTSAFIVPSEFGRRMLVRAGLPEEKAHVLSNAVADPGPRVQAPSASRDLVFVGRLSHEKGIKELVDTFTDSATDLNLVVIGDGPVRLRVTSRDSTRIVIRGWLEHHEIPAVLKSARALVFPSVWFEMCPLVILEAFAAGLPVLATDLGALRELVGSVDDGLLVKPGRWEEALNLVSEGSRVDDLGRQARSRFELNHSLEVHATRLEQLYLEVTHPVPAG